MIAPRLREQPEEVQDVFAVARAALDGYDVTDEWTDEVQEAIFAAMVLRRELGWDG